MTAACQRPLPALTTSKGWRGIASDRRSFRVPPPIRRRGFGSSRRHEGLGKRLHDLRQLRDALPREGPDYSFKEPVLGPQLKVYAVPDGCGGGGAPLGLSKHPNLQNRARSGISGISAYGRKFLKDSLLLMEDFRERLCMWTVTLPDGDYEEMVGTRKWPIFQTRIRDGLLRHLKAEGDEALAVGAVEIGALRLSKDQRPRPHIHIVTTGWGRRSRDGRWVCSPKVMDHIIAKAAQYAGLESRPRLAASNVAPIRTSVHNYLSKYLTKDAPPGEMDLTDGWDELIPRQWWLASEAARALVVGALFRLPTGFAAFLVQRQRDLENAALVHARAITIATRKTITGEMPIEVTRFKFRGTDAIRICLEYYALWCDNPNVTIAGAAVMS